MTAWGYPDIVISQAYQPTQQGAVPDLGIYFFKVSDHRYGFFKSDSKYNSLLGIAEDRYIQNYETTFQVQAWSIQDPNDTSRPTASDLVNMAAQALQNPSAVKVFKSSDVGILRVTDVRNPQFADDRDRNEASPSFDFTLTHKQIITAVYPAAVSIEGNIYEV